MSDSTSSVPRLEDWVTLTEAAEILGTSRQTVHNRVARGCFQALRTIGGVRIVREDEVRAQMPVRRRGDIPNLSVRQVETLIRMLSPDTPRPWNGYSHYVNTARSLVARGLVEPHRSQLTDEGRRVAERLAAGGT